MKNTQIHVVKSLVYTIVVSIVVGFIIFVGSQRYYNSTISKTELAHATLTLEALNNLQLGDTKKAIEILDKSLELSAASLRYGPDGISSSLYKKMQARLKEIQQHQTANKK